MRATRCRWSAKLHIFYTRISGSQDITIHVSFNMQVTNALTYPVVPISIFLHYVIAVHQFVVEMYILRLLTVKTPWLWELCISPLPQNAIVELLEFKLIHMDKKYCIGLDELALSSIPTHNTSVCGFCHLLCFGVTPVWAGSPFYAGEA